MNKGTVLIAFAVATGVCAKSDKQADKIEIRI